MWVGCGGCCRGGGEGWKTRISRFTSILGCDRTLAKSGFEYTFLTRRASKHQIYIAYPDPAPHHPSPSPSHSPPLPHLSPPPSLSPFLTPQTGAAPPPPRSAASPRTRDPSSAPAARGAPRGAPRRSACAASRRRLRGTCAA